MAVLEFKELSLTPEEIYLNMGTGGTRNINPEIAEAIEWSKFRAVRLMEARCLYQLATVRVSGSRQVLLNESYPLTCSSRFFQGAGRAALVLVTLGPRLEAEVSSLFQAGELLEGLALDACGTAMVNQLMDLAREAIGAAECAQAEKLGYTLNPGCHTIPLEDQKIIFAILESNRIGVSLTDSDLMIPVKSYSAIIPMGVNLPVPNSKHACEICNRRKSCTFSPVHVEVN